MCLDRPRLSEIITSRGLEEYNGDCLIPISSFDRYSNNSLARSDSRYHVPDGALYEHWLTDYASDARAAGTYSLKADLSPLGDGKYRYEYNGRGRQGKMWTYNEFDGSNMPSRFMIYDYVDDEISNWIEQPQRHL
jgi:hypothetical protein